MTPLTLSLACLALVAISGNFLSLVKSNKILLFISIIPSLYVLVYGFYLTFGSIDLHEDASKNFFLRNPTEKELPIVFIILKFYQYILIVVGATFSYLYLKYLKR